MHSHKTAVSVLSVALLVVAACASGEAADPTTAPTSEPATTAAPTTDATDTTAAPETTTTTTAAPAVPENASVVIISGDGMGPQQRAAIQYYWYGLEERQPMDALDVAGLLDTVPADPVEAVSDSAAGATAWATGLKVPNGMTGLGPDGEPVPTLLAIAQEAGKSTGLVNDHDITNATLASFGSPVADRDLKLDIAQGYLDNGVDVLFGGGEQYWYPEGDEGMIPDEMEDDASENTVNLVEQAQELGYQYAYDRDTVAGLTGPKALALVQDSAKRRLTEVEGYDYASDPHYVAPEILVAKALEILGQNPNGFFLVIESDDLDSDAHEHDASNMMLAGESVNAMVSAVTAYQQDHPEVLLIVTADHETGGMTIENVEEPNSDQVADDPVPYWVPEEEAENMPLPDGAVPARSGPFQIKGTDRWFKVDWTTPEHTGSYVPVTASGPLAERLTGVHHNTYVFEVVYEVLTGQPPA